MEEVIALVKTFGVLAVLVWYIVYSETRIRPRVDTAHAAEREVWRKAMELQAQLSRETLQRATTVQDELLALMREIKDHLSSDLSRHSRADSNPPRDSPPH